jgi:hypothetical protein
MTDIDVDLTILVRIIHDMLREVDQADQARRSAAHRARFAAGWRPFSGERFVS